MSTHAEVRGKTVGWGSIAAAAQMIAGVVRNKALSAAVGTAGVGLIAETQQLATTVFVPATALGGPALTRHIVGGQQSTQDPRPVLDTLLTFGVAYTLMAIAIALPTAHVLAPSWLNHGYGVIVLPIAVAGTATLSGAFGQVLIASGLVVSQARVQASSSLAAALLAAVLAFPFGVKGALAGTLVGQALAVVLMIRQCIGGQQFRDWHPRLRLDTRFLGDSFRFGATGFIAASALQGSLSLVRGVLGADGNSEANGLFQASWALGYTYLGLLFSGFSSYFFPRISGCAPGMETHREVRSASWFVLSLVVPMVMVAVPLREFVVRLLYSSAFIGAASLLGLHLAAAPLRALGIATGGSLLFQGRLRLYAAIELSAAAIHGFGAVYAFPRWGLVGAGLAYCVSYVAYAWAAWAAMGLANGWSGNSAILPVMGTLAALGLLLMTRIPQAPSAWGLIAISLGAVLLAFAARPILQSVLRRSRT